MGSTITLDKIRDFEDISQHNEDGVDDYGQNIGNFIPKEVNRKLSTAKLNINSNKLELRSQVS